MSRAWLLLAASLVAIPASAEKLTVADAAVIAALSADVVSTHIARQRGGLESNPAYGSMGAQVIIQTGVTTVVLWQCHRWDQQGHRKAARIVRWSLVGLWGGAAAWNLTKGGRR